MCNKILVHLDPSKRGGEGFIYIEQEIGWVGEDDSELSFPERCAYGPLRPDPPTYKTKMMNPKTKPTTSSKQGPQHPTRP